MFNRCRWDSLCQTSVQALRREDSRGSETMPVVAAFSVTLWNQDPHMSLKLGRAGFWKKLGLFGLTCVLARWVQLSSNLKKGICPELWPVPDTLWGTDEKQNQGMITCRLVLGVLFSKHKFICEGLERCTPEDAPFNLNCICCMLCLFLHGEGYISPVFVTSPLTSVLCAYWAPLFFF